MDRRDWLKVAGGPATTAALAGCTAIADAGAQMANEDGDREYDLADDALIEGESEGDVSTSGSVRIAPGGEPGGSIEAGSDVELGADSGADGSVFIN